jgi:hypothetical protein
MVAEVVDVVVGHTEEVEARFFEQWSETGGGTEGEAGARYFLRRSTAVAECTFHIACGYVCCADDRCYMLEDVFAVVGRELYAWESGTHHNIPSEGELDDFVAGDVSFACRIGSGFPLFGWGVGCLIFFVRSGVSATTESER